MMRTALTGLFCCMLLLAAGCGSGQPSLTEITGDVTFNGEPIEQGEVFFVDETAASGGYGARIENGAYSVSLPEGSYPVRVTAMRETGEMEAGPGGPEDPQVPVLEMYIPPMFNSRTELVAEVGDESTRDFHLSASR